MTAAAHRQGRVARPLAGLALCLAALAPLTAGRATAGEWQVSGSLSAELRAFPTPPAYPGQDSRTVTPPSFSFEPQITYSWNDGADRLTFVPFVRLADSRSDRGHADLREANWLHLADNWNLVVGIDKVFWGVAESRHLVDIINQDDTLEDIDGEDKLGQPMVNLNLLSDFGTFGLFVLPGFRERQFPDNSARLGGALPVITDDARFQSPAGNRRVDYALRWEQSLGNWDIGLSYFSGTSREPRLLPEIRPGGVVLVPQYDLIRQTGLDLQFTSGDWLLKLEAISRSGQGPRFQAAVAGFERSFYGVFGTSADIGLLAEYSYDGRDPALAPATAFDDDLFIGARLALNDVGDTSLVGGAIIDRNTSTTIYFLEAERRLGDNWKVEVEGRFFSNVAPGDPLATIRNDDFITLRLSRFF